MALRPRRGRHPRMVGCPVNGWELETPQQPDCLDCGHEEKGHERAYDLTDGIKPFAGRCLVEGCGCERYERGET